MQTYKTVLLEKSEITVIVFHSIAWLYEKFSWLKNMDSRMQVQDEKVKQMRSTSKDFGRLHSSTAHRNIKNIQTKVRISH